jgi:FAD/FMN-containing dehydrogenase
MVPLCLVQPRSAEAVATVVKSVREHKCRFAVKSGGHSLARGTSNRQDGLVIDLKHLNQIKVSDDKETAFVGSGNTWGDVYRELDPQGLAIVGGRVPSVGVGGFTLGGRYQTLLANVATEADMPRWYIVSLPSLWLGNRQRPPV